jgi:hypothetical protein
VAALIAACAVVASESNGVVSMSGGRAVCPPPGRAPLYSGLATVAPAQLTWVASRHAAGTPVLGPDDQSQYGSLIWQPTRRSASSNAIR